LIGVGNSKYACLYDAKQKLMLRRFVMSNNRSLDGVMRKLNSGKIVPEIGGTIEDIDLDESGSEDDKKEDHSCRELRKLKM